MSRLSALMRHWRRRRWVRDEIAAAVGHAMLDEPLVVYTASMENPLGLAGQLGGLLRRRDALFLIGSTWETRTPAVAARRIEAARRHARRFPRHRVVFVVNDDAEFEVHRRSTAKVFLWNQNAMVDEAVFRPLSDEPAGFDAIYNAMMTPWKRHALAAAIPSVAYVYYREPHLDWPTTLDYFECLRAGAPRHEFVNPLGDRRFGFLTQEEVNRWLNRAHVGLCLSESEGAMFASMEYLLAGLPIVSTPSIGGRDRFFDPEYCILVEPEPRAIAEAVAALKARRIPREHVRTRTLERVRRERERLRDWLIGSLGSRAPGKIPSDVDDPFYRRRYSHRSLDRAAGELGLRL